MIVLNLDSDQKICVTLGDIFVINIDFKQKCVTLSHSILLNLDFVRKTCALVDLNKIESIRILLGDIFFIRFTQNISLV